MTDEIRYKGPSLPNPNCGPLYSDKVSPVDWRAAVKRLIPCVLQELGANSINEIVDDDLRDALRIAAHLSSTPVLPGNPELNTMLITVTVGQLRRLVPSMPDRSTEAFGDERLKAYNDGEANIICEVEAGLSRLLGQAGYLVR